MQSMDVTKAIPAATEAAEAPEDRLLSLARELSGLRHDLPARRETIGRIARGLAELADLGRLCGQMRVSRACKALATILDRLDPDREDDADFILSTSLNFLDAIQARRITACKGAA